MAKKLESFYGNNEDELKKMSIEEFAKIVRSRTRRALVRLVEKNNNPEYRKLIEKVRKLKQENKLNKPVRTHVRDAVIIPEWLGLKFSVHNGKEWNDVEITIDKLGHRLGEYSYTTKAVKHSGAGVGATRGSKFVPLK